MLVALGAPEQPAPSVAAAAPQVAGPRAEPETDRVPADTPAAGAEEGESQLGLF